MFVYLSCSFDSQKAMIRMAILHSSSCRRQIIQCFRNRYLCSPPLPPSSSVSRTFFNGYTKHYVLCLFLHILNMSMQVQSVLCTRGGGEGERVSGPFSQPSSPPPDPSRLLLLATEIHQARPSLPCSTDGCDPS